ncbi:unnamed protein product, partial [Nesidiocoris tenuis]
SSSGRPRGSSRGNGQRDARRIRSAGGPRSSIRSCDVTAPVGGRSCSRKLRPVTPSRRI